MIWWAESPDPWSWESWNNSDNVFPGAAPEDQDDGAGAEADGALHLRHQSQALQARAHVQCSSVYPFDYIELVK